MWLLNPLMEWLTPRAARSWPLDNQIQAQAFSGILTEEGIPHKVRRNGEALFAYPEKAREGWGRLEADEEYHEQIEQLFNDFLDSVPGEPEQQD